MNYLLSVGINKYKEPGNDLKGCVNDVLNIKKTLAETAGFSYVAMKTLFDQQATKENILTALKDMIRLSVKGDHLVYHHSSHGSQVPDKDGDELDALDEILCTYDFDWNGTYITDDELRVIVSQLKKGVTLDVILDACHTGTQLREIGILPKFIPPPFKSEIRTTEFRLIKINKLLIGNLPSGVTLWAGCKSDQTSADAFINGSYNGALTYYFCDELRRTQGKVYRSRLYNNIRQSMCAYEQTPQLECSWYRRYRKVFC